MARRPRRTKPPAPTFHVKRGPDGFPIISHAEEQVLGRKGEFETVCLMCYAQAAFIAADVRGRLYVYCQACGTRVFTGGRASTERLLRGHHRLLQDEEARAHAMQLLATQVD